MRDILQEIESRSNRAACDISVGNIHKAQQECMEITKLANQLLYPEIWEEKDEK